MNDYSQIEVDDVERISEEQIGEGNVNDNPEWVFEIKLPSGERGWVAGPHGVSCCAISEWLRYVGAPAATRDQAIDKGCDHA